MHKKKGGYTMEEGFQEIQESEDDLLEEIESMRLDD
jgi:hypothetical protein